MSLPSSSTTLIQIIGRALRLDPKRGKTIAKVILPFSKKEDEKAISNFNKVMAKNDSRIRQSYDNKKLGGYFNIENIFDDEENIEDLDLMEELDLKYELIFDKMGTLKNSEEIWMNKLEEVKKYIDENKKRPTSKNKDNKIRHLGQWLSQQINHLKTRTCLMKNDIMYNKFKYFIETYKKYFLSNEEIWNNNLEKVITYIDENNKLPSSNSKDATIRTLGLWIGTQKQKLKKNIEIMKNNIIRNKFKYFIETYKEYFLLDEQIWSNILEKVINYIINNNKLPLNNDKDVKIRYLRRWIYINKHNYKTRIGLMKDDIIYNKFKNFIETYNKYLLTKEEQWNYTLEKVIKYINENNKLPSTTSKDKEIKKLGYWIGTQKKTYILRECIMKDDIIYNIFNNFLEKYEEYFISYEEIWNSNFKKVIKYINENNKLPSSHDKNKDIKGIGVWIIKQKMNYKNRERLMKDEIIYNNFKDFLETYKEYFLQ
jgi:hypothetical protein